MVTNAIFMTMSKPKERAIAAGEFKAKCLALLDQVEARGRSFVVTKRGRPVARVVPLESTATSLHGTLLHEVETDGLLAPVSAEWDALS